MADLYFAGKSPVESGQKLIGLVLSGDYVGVATVDAAFETAGRVNALRGPEKMGAVADAPVASECPCENDLAAMASQAQAELPPTTEGMQAAGESEDGETALSPAAIAALLQLAWGVIQFFLKRNS